MLKYRINKKEVINNSNIITVENVEDYRTIEEEKNSEIESVDDTFICTFTCKSIDSLNANENAKNKIYTVHNFSAIDDGGTEYPCKYTYEYEVDGSVVNSEKNTFSLELSKLFLLPTVSIGRVATYPNDADIDNPTYYMYVYFQNSHLFNRYNNNGDVMKIKLYFNCYTLNTIEFFPLEMEYVTPFSVRYKWDDKNENLKKLFQDEQNNVNIHDVEVYRENPLFGVYDNYIIYNNSPVCSINLPLGIKFRTDLQKEQLMTDYLTDRRKKSINRITDMEKDVYHPVQWDNEKNEKKNDIYQIIFNLHFREHRYDDWNAAPDSYWNGVIFNAKEKKLELMKNSKQEELGYFSYDGDEWKHSDQSDLLSYLNFTNEDIRYQKSRLKKSFLRLLFFDSMNPADQNLLAYSTVFIDSGMLFSKYVRHFEGEGFSALNYNGDIVLPASLNLNGIRINREPMVDGEIYEEFKDNLENIRLSSQFVIKDKYNSTTSSEGFYLYLWRDNDNGIIPSDLYMKVEFNHAGYGRTIPFMMPYKDKDDDGKEKGEIKTFKEIVKDWSPIKNEDKNENENKDKYVGYGIKRYLKYSYIHLKYQYDTVDKRHVYYVDTDLYKGTDKSIYGIDNTMKFDLYEAKINFDSEVTVNEVGTSSEYEFSVDKDTITFEQEGGKVTVNVTSVQKKNGQPDRNLKFVVNENGLNWCKWEQNGNTITITAEENNYNRKQGTLILIQEKSNKQIRINVSQEEKAISTVFEANPLVFNVEDKGDTCEVKVVSTYDKVIIKDKECQIENDKVLFEYVVKNGNITIDGKEYKVINNKVTIEYQVIDNKVTINSKEYIVEEGKITIDGNEYTVKDDKVIIDYQVVNDKVIIKYTIEHGNVIIEGTEYTLEEIDYTIDITSADNAKVEWITNINQSSDGFTFDVKANEEATKREASITLTQLLDSSENSTPIEIAISQEAKREYTFMFKDGNEQYTLTVDNKDGVYEVRVISKDSKNTRIPFTASADTNNVVNNIEIIEVTDGEVGEFILKITCERTDSLSELQDKITLIQDDSEEELTLNVIQEDKPIEYDFYFEDEPTVAEKDETVPYTATNKQYKIVSKDNRDNNIDIILPTNNDIIENINITYVNDGIYNLSFDITQNDDVDVRDASIVLTQETSGKKLTINISQMCDKTIVLPDFDNLILRYNWTADDGRDFDTMTVINGTGLTINNKKVDDYNVGYGSGNTNSNFVLMHGGDNRISGDETCLIRMGDICSEENLLTMKTNGVKSFYIDIYGLWYDSKNKGNITIEMTAYKGGTVSLGTGDNAFKWIVNGGEKVLTTTLSTNVNAFVNCSSNSASIRPQYCRHYKDSYTKIGRVTYNIKTKVAYLTLTGVKSGWMDKFELCVLPSLVENISSDGASGIVTFKSSKNGSMLNCTIKTSADWLTAIISGNEIHYTVRPNKATANRQTRVEVIQDFTNFNVDLIIKQLGVTE